MNKILKRLFELQDIEYKEFTSKLIPNVDKDKIIGIRIPVLRDLAKEIFKSGDYEDFLKELPHQYLEEYSLHGFITEQIKDFDKVVEYLNAFLPFVDNWSVCDTCTPKIFKKYTSDLLPYIYKWINSDKLYMRRYAIRMLMAFYLDEKFDEKYLEIVASVKSDEYYLKMMVAWYFATALAKQYDSAVKFIEDKKLDVWTHNKSIQKAKESFRVSDEHKIYLSRLIVKK